MRAALPPTGTAIFRSMPVVVLTCALISFANAIAADNIPGATLTLLCTKIIEISFTIHFEKAKKHEARRPVDGVTGRGLPSKQAALATALLMARCARLAWKASGRPSH